MTTTIVTAKTERKPGTKILIGYDNSPCADEALTGLLLAGLPPETEALMLVVSETCRLPAGEGEMAVAGMLHSPLESTSFRHEKQISKPAVRMTMAKSTGADSASDQLLALRNRSAPAAQRLQRMFPKWKVSLEVEYGPALWAIIDRARTWEADLIAVGAHSRLSEGRVLLGMVAVNALMHASCSVRVCRSDLRQSHGPLRIIIAYDGSPDSECALQQVSTRCWPAGTVVRVVSVIDSTWAGLLPSRNCDTRNSEVYLGRCCGGSDFSPWLKATCESAAESIRQSGIPTDLSMPQGDAESAILDEARRWGADCLFLGAQGCHSLGQHGLGPVTTRVAMRAPCTVEVIRTRQESSGQGRLFAADSSDIAAGPEARTYSSSPSHSTDVHARRQAR